MVREFLWSNRKRLVGALVVCVVLLGGLTVWLQMGRVAEAAVLDPHPGLVGWWRFDEGVGSVVKDSSGFGNDGAVYGAAWVDGKYGKALSFDGIDDYVDCGHNSILNVKDAVTILAWINSSNWGHSGSANTILAKGDQYQLGVSPSGKLGFYLKIGGLWKGSWNFGVTILGTNTLYFVAFVYNGSTMRVYLNAVLDGSADQTGDIDSTPNNLAIGRYSILEYFKGIIDEVRIYNRALSAAEIQESFQKRPDFSSKLLAKVPKGTTQVLITLLWQGIGTINITIESPSKSYTEDTVPFYQKTFYSTSGGTSSMLNIKRLSVPVTALSSDENWYVVLKFDDVEDYRITVEVQK